MKKVIVLAVIIACSSYVFAQSVGQWQGEVSYVRQTITDTSTNNLGKFSINGLNLGVSNVVMDNLAVEGFVNLPSSTATNSYAGPATVSIKTKTGYGLSVRPFVKITNELELFGRIGRAKNKTEFSSTSPSGNESDSTNTVKNFYGLGVGYSVTKEVTLVTDYKKIIGIDGAKVTNMGFGVRYNF